MPGRTRNKYSVSIYILTISAMHQVKKKKNRFTFVDPSFNINPELSLQEQKLFQPSEKIEFSKK